MDGVIQWLSANPRLAITLALAVCGLLSALLLLLAFAVLSGRPVRIWRLYIGGKPGTKEHSQEPSHAVRRPVVASDSVFITVGELAKRDPLESVIARTNDLLLGGIALGGSAQRHIGQLIERVENGASLRFLVLDPNSSDTASIAQVFNVPARQVRDDILVTLRSLETVRQRTQAAKGGRVEVRMMSREPTFSFLVSNARADDGVFHGGLHLHGYRATARPYWILTRSDSWFAPFVSACEQLWHVSRPARGDAGDLTVEKAGTVPYRRGTADEPEVLLISARTDPSKWIFPVGGLDPGETLEQAAERETLEESGYRVALGPVISVLEFERGSHPERLTFFLARAGQDTAIYEDDRRRRWVKLSALRNDVAGDFLPVAVAAIEKLRG